MQKVPSPEDDFPDVFDSVIKALVAGDRAKAESELAPISFQAQELTKRPSLTTKVQVEVFVRDRFRCRYCGGRVILTPVMRVLSALFPEQVPYHPNWKSDATHPAIWSRSASVDHIEPGSFGGDWRDPENLATACWPCNARKGDLTLERLDWELLPVPVPDGWDGLTGNYEQLWKLAGEPAPGTHEPWISALGRATL